MTTYSWQLLRCGAFRLDGGSMFGVVPKALWSKLSPPDDANRIELQTNCLLLDDGSSRIIIETGCGGKWSDKDSAIFHMEQRTILDALREVGVEPGQIDHIVISHLHFDHAGGLTHLDERGEPVSSFPNAAIHVQTTEWADALANKSTMTKTYLRSHLDPIANQITPADGEMEVASGVIVMPMVGHTWGHQAVRFADEQGVLCFTGDLMPTAAHVGLAFNMGYDMLPYANTQSKRELLARAAGDGWRIVLDHEPGEPIVHVQSDPDRPGAFRLDPADG